MTAGADPPRAVVTFDAVRHPDRADAVLEAATTAATDLGDDDVGDVQPADGDDRSACFVELDRLRGVLRDLWDTGDVTGRRWVRDLIGERP